MRTRYSPFVCKAVCEKLRQRAWFVSELAKNLHMSRQTTAKYLHYLYNHRGTKIKRKGKGVRTYYYI